MKNLFFILLVYTFFGCQQKTPQNDVSLDTSIQTTPDTTTTILQKIKAEEENEWKQKKERLDRMASESQKKLLQQSRVVFYGTKRNLMSSDHIAKRVNGKIYTYCTIPGNDKPLVGSMVVFVWEKGDTPFKITYSAW